MTQPAPESLDDDYYLTNFHTLAGFVVNTYVDLLHPDEIDWYQRVNAAPLGAQRLYIRLLTRKRSTFRLSRVNYAEIADCGQCAEALADKGLASTQPPEELGLLLSSFTKPELLDWLDLSNHRQLSKVNLVELITASPLMVHYQRKLQAADRWVTPQGHAAWTLMQLCFFGNLYQDSSEFVLRQLGTLQYEAYPLDPSSRAFTSREQIEAHLHYYECDALFDCANLRDNALLLGLAGSLPVLDKVDINLQRRVDRLRNRIARQLERNAKHDEAMALYQLSLHPPARERRVRRFLAKDQFEAGLSLVEQMLESPHNEAERLIAQRLNSDFQKRLGLPVKKQRVFKPETTTLVLQGNGTRVESLARQFYSNKGQCFNTENTLVNGVLGLFIWDIIFHSVPGVFFNPFQMAPADFHQPQFKKRRAALLSSRFAELSDAACFRDRVTSAFEQHAGKLNPLVRWQGFSEELLALAIERIPPAHWQVLFTRILADTRENTAGFPDLVLFPDAGGYEFIEIKGPGDALQANQRRWMKYFDEHGIACRLVHVRYRQIQSSDSAKVGDVAQKGCASTAEAKPERLLADEAITEGIPTDNRTGE